MAHAEEPISPAQDSYEQQLGLNFEAPCEVHLDDFEGPLDLLLHLVKRHELDILDIPISFVTEKYLEYLEMMRALNMDVAGTYLVMASTLAYLKSRELLPHEESNDALDEEDDDGPPAKEALIRRLLAYQRYKEAANHLSSQPILSNHVFPLGAPAERSVSTDAPLEEIGTFELLSALASILKRRQLELSYDVLVDRISISDRIDSLIKTLAAQKTVTLDDLIDSSCRVEETRHFLVVTFLALLEMTRLRLIRILQETAGSNIYLTRREESDTP